MTIQEELDRFTADARFFDEQRDALLERFPEQFVAIYNREVVGAASEMTQLVAELKRRGIPPGEVYHEYLSRKPVTLMLLERR